MPVSRQTENEKGRPEAREKKESRIKNLGSEIRDKLEEYKTRTQWYR